jgi:hypothetical protein
MSVLCIVPCGKKKIWDKEPNAKSTKARYVYIGPFAKKCKEYAEHFYPHSWCILSAKYGFLFPDEVIPSNYNVSFVDKNSKTITIDELSLQIKSKNIDKYDKIIVLGGKYYLTIVKKVFPKKKVFNPLKDCKGIGYMMQKLNSSIKTNINIEANSVIITET